MTVPDNSAEDHSWHWMNSKQGQKVSLKRYWNTKKKDGERKVMNASKMWAFSDSSHKQWTSQRVLWLYLNSEKQGGQQII